MDTWWLRLLVLFYSTLDAFADTRQMCLWLSTMNMGSKPRMALFFDGANHTQALEQAKVKMHYAKLLENLNRTNAVIGARYYSGISERPEHKGVREFLGSISKSGYTLVTKPIREYPDGTVKGNVDVEIAVDMMTMAPRLDRVILFSGDGDFAYLVDTVQRMGIHVAVCSYKPFAAIELRDKSSEFLEIQTLAKDYNW